MVDSRLADQGREPRDVQLVVERETTAEAPGRVSLHDGEGVFLVAEVLTTEPAGGPAVSVEDTHASSPPPAVRTSDRTPDRDAERLEERDRLAADVEQYCAELESSRAEVERARTEVQGVKKRLKEVWRKNCDQLLQHEEELAAKDPEISGLDRKLLVALGNPSKTDHPDDVSGTGSEK
jgi:hypothetical protein